MRGHGAHMWMCAGMIVVALGLVLITGNPFAFIPDHRLRADDGRDDEHDGRDGRA